MVEERGELYINKKVTLLKTKRQLLNNAINDAHTKNIIMIKDNGQYKAIFLPIARYYNRRKTLIPVQNFDKAVKTHKFVYNSICDRVFRYFYVITTNKNAMSSKFPIWMGQNEFMIYPNTEIYFTLSLYEKLKTKLTFTGFTTLTDSQVKYLQRDLLFFKDNRKFYI